MPMSYPCSNSSPFVPIPIIYHPFLIYSTPSLLPLLSNSSLSLYHTTYSFSFKCPSRSFPSPLHGHARPCMVMLFSMHFDSHVYTLITLPFSMHHLLSSYLYYHLSFFPIPLNPFPLITSSTYSALAHHEFPFFPPLYLWLAGMTTLTHAWPPRTPSFPKLASAWEWGIERDFQRSRDWNFWGRHLWAHCLERDGTMGAILKSQGWERWSKYTVFLTEPNYYIAWIMPLSCTCWYEIHGLYPCLDGEPVDQIRRVRASGNESRAH